MKKSCCKLSSIAKKQIVALTGLMLVGFLAGHLAGNLFIFAGEQAFNAYAEKLAHLRPGLYVVEVGLAFIFLIHVALTVSIVRDNRAARGAAYEVYRSKGKSSVLSRLMPVTGFILFSFIIYHLLDFTFSDHQGTRSLIDGSSQGLYGVVVNAFKNPLHAGGYIIAMICVALHLNHGVQSVVQTFGWNHPTYTPLVRKIGLILAWIVGSGFSSIPVYCFFL